MFKNYMHISQNIEISCFRNYLIVLAFIQLFPKWLFYCQIVFCATFDGTDFKDQH